MPLSFISHSGVLPVQGLLEDQVLNVMLTYRQPPKINEGGGILLGLRQFQREQANVARFNGLGGTITEPQLLTICDCTVPGRGDKSGRTFFHRSPRRAQTAIDEAWKRSDGRINYLGEWHTHPEPYPTPSFRDRAMIAEMHRATQASWGPLLLVIVGQKEIWVGVQCSTGLSELNTEGTISITTNVNIPE